MSEEFEDRENQLGEVPEPLLRERGESVDWRKEADVPPGTGGMFPGGQQPMPGDIAQQNTLLGQPGANGVGPRGAFVTTTFPAMPVNGERFYFKQTKSFVTLQAETPEIVRVNFTETVPTGKVFILRGFRVNYNTGTFSTETIEVTNDGSPIELFATVVANGIAAGSFSLQQIRLLNRDFLPVYALAEGEQNIGVQLQAELLGTGFGSGTMTLDVELIGDVLLSRGLPVNYEPANLPRF